MQCAFSVPAPLAGRVHVRSQSTSRCPQRLGAERRVRFACRKRSAYGATMTSRTGAGDSSETDPVVVPETCSVPQDAAELISQAVAAITSAEATAGHNRRHRVTALIPGLNSLIEDTYPYNDALLMELVMELAVRLSQNTSEQAGEPERVCILFKSVGTAAAAAKYYSQTRTSTGKGVEDGSPSEPSDGNVPTSPTRAFPEHITLGSYAKRDGPRVGEGPLVPPGARAILVNPMSSRGDPLVPELTQLVNETSDATCKWVMVNEDFSGDRSAAGIAEMGRRNEFLSSFSQTYYMRNLFVIKRPKLIPVEKGVLLKSYPHPWTLFSFQNGTYGKLREFDSSPSREVVADALERATMSVPNPLKGEIQDMTRQDQKVVQLLALMSVGVGAVFGLLRLLAVQ